MNKLLYAIAIIASSLSLSCSSTSTQATGGFPSVLPLEKPQDRELSAATTRLYDKWNIYGDSRNELFSNFKYSEIEGLPTGGNISRRDPTKVIKVDGIYYVYYTYRNTQFAPQGYDKATDLIPSFDWDLSDIYYATSKDGFVWEEQGAAIVRPQRPEYGWRSVTTPGILMWKGKYYIYFQAFNEIPGGERGDSADVRVAVADSPAGPFNIIDKDIIPYGAKGEWDANAIHDPCPIVHDGKIMIYYKGQGVQSGKRDVSLVIAGGVAYATDPLGPFEKSPLNPVFNSGHETCVFPFKEGIAAIVSLNGPEKNTIQYATDGVNFEIASHIIMPPIAPAPYSPDVFADTKDGQGITWGLCHVSADASSSFNCNMLMRFDCDLSTQLDAPKFKSHNRRFKMASYFDATLKLTPSEKRGALSFQKSFDVDTRSK